MVEFSSLLRKPVGQAKKPQVLPAEDYPGIIKGHEVTENKFMTPPQPIVRLILGLIGWPDAVAEEDRVQDGQAIDLAKRQLRRDYRFNAANPGVEDDLWRLDELISALGIEPRGRGYDEILPELHGAQVIVEVQQYMNQKTYEMGNQVGKLHAPS